MDFQPTLQGKLLSLRPLREDDLEGLFSVASDPLLWEMHPARDRYQRPIFEKFFRQGIASESALAVLDATNGKIIGTSRFAAWPGDPNYRSQKALLKLGTVAVGTQPGESGHVNLIYEIK